MMDLITIVSIYGAMAMMAGAMWYLFENTVFGEESL
jgi:hypothetical protein